jgi:S-formylglutathione hydrolase FrmB
VTRRVVQMAFQAHVLTFTFEGAYTVSHLHVHEIVIGGVLLLLAWPPAAGAACVEQAPPLQPISEVALNSRLIEVTFVNPLINPPLPETKVRILLPSNYATGSNYPVLYLLHGMNGNAASWSTIRKEQESLESLTAGKNVLVVMPDGGATGFYTDWYNGGTFGAPAWQRYHICQLTSWVESRYRVRRDRGGRAIGGISMGGFGTMSYAARHPDLFGAAVSFSGAVNNIPFAPVSLPVAPDSIPGLFAVPPLDLIWGPYLQEEVRWRGDNPVDLADNLRPVRLWLRTGRGIPGGPGPDDNDPRLLAMEAGVALLNDTFHFALERLDIPHTYDPYPQGAHSGWHYLEGFSLAWPLLEEVFSAPPSSPSSFNYRSIAQRFSVFGWTFAAERDVTEFLYVEDAGRGGLKLRGSGKVHVVTPPVYQPGSWHLLTAPAIGVTVWPNLAVADAEGRVSFTVNLGWSHVLQQYTLAQGLAEAADPFYWKESRINIH